MSLAAQCCKLAARQALGSYPMPSSTATGDGDSRLLGCPGTHRGLLGRHRQDDRPQNVQSPDVLPCKRLPLPEQPPRLRPLLLKLSPLLSAGCVMTYQSSTLAALYQPRLLQGQHSVCSAATGQLVARTAAAALSQTRHTRQLHTRGQLTTSCSRLPLSYSGGCRLAVSPKQQHRFLWKV